MNALLPRLAIPLALVSSWILAQTGLGRFFMRTASGMWLHELGHAVAAWTCGFPAFPGPWFTSVGEERSWLFALPLAGVLGWLLWQAREQENRAAAWAAGAALAVQLFGTLVLRPREAATLITFGGDAGSLVFGAALMATVFAPPGHKLHRDWLRWGFLGLGAASFMDVFDQWWKARRDVGIIPFGEMEHGGESDPTKLVAEFGWTVPDLVGRYVALGIACLLALAALQVVVERRRRRAAGAERLVP
jgi:hypothetical protein